jgi:peptidoglycan-associated lipoprotein
MDTNEEKEEKMRKRIWMILALMLLVPAMLFTVSCAKKAVVTEPTVSEEEAARRAEAEKARLEELERQRALEEERLRQEAAMQEEKAKLAMMEAREQFMNENIHFEFDKSSLLPEAQEILTRKAAWLGVNPGERVIIEGHCDERGTNEYNLALGDRRAESAKSFLVDLGIDAARLTTISYGEERPVDPAHNEEAWAKNRRAHFVVE